MREYHITFNPLSPTLARIGPFVIRAELKEEALDCYRKNVERTSWYLIKSPLLSNAHYFMDKN